MIKTVRLSYFGEDWDKIRVNVITLLLNKFNEKMGQCDDKTYAGWHVGNYCFVDVKKETAENIIDIIPELKIDAEYKYLEQSDLNLFKKGDKVKVGLFFGNQKGVVYSITDDQIVIRKFHSQSKGWIFNVGNKFDVERV